jgi:hypothetical protein
MVTNDDGWIALKRYQTINKIIKVGGEEYLFHTRANICLSWVRPEHVGQVLGITRMCCGGNKKPQFRYANEADVRRWTVGGGR